MEQPSQATMLDKTVKVNIMLPKTLRTNIEQEAEYNKLKNLGFTSFSAVLANRLRRDKLPKPIVINDKERMVARTISLPQSLHEDITNEANENRNAHKPFMSFSSVLVHRLQHVKLFVIPKK